jgi:hypothetical protein
MKNGLIIMFQDRTVLKESLFLEHFFSQNILRQLLFRKNISLSNLFSKILNWFSNFIIRVGWTRALSTPSQTLCPKCRV